MSKQDEKKLYEQQEEKILAQSDAFISLLTKRGILADQKIDSEKVRSAKQEKTKAALLTVSGEGRAAANCSLTIKMPGTCEKDAADRNTGMEGSRQPMGALFEQSVLLLLDGLVLELMESLQETSKTMMRRHANLE